MIKNRVKYLNHNIKNKIQVKNKDRKNLNVKSQTKKEDENQKITHRTKIGKLELGLIK